MAFSSFSDEAHDVCINIHIEGVVICPTEDEHSYMGRSIIIYTNNFQQYMLYIIIFHTYILYELSMCVCVVILPLVWNTVCFFDEPILLLLLPLAPQKSYRVLFMLTLRSQVKAQEKKYKANFRAYLC